MPVSNLVSLHRCRAGSLGPRVALRHRRDGVFRDLSWADYRARALACAAALIDAGVGPGDRVGLLSENRVEWLVADMGILTAAAVNVPPHAPLTAAQVEYQLQDAGVVWLFVSTAAQLAKVRAVRDRLPDLRGVVVFDAAAAGDDAEPWFAFLQRGRQALPRLADTLRQREEALGPDDLATIMYTSGTTGLPKGVMLTHGNLLSNAESTFQSSDVGPDAVVLNWLPLSHIYARTIDHYQNLASTALVVLADSAETLVADLAEVQPTHMASVPRFYEKVLGAVAADDPKETGRRLRGIFGPRVKWLSSGGAPLPVAVAQAYHDAGLKLLQGYGLTESSPVISFNRITRFKIDSVGPAIPGVEVAIAPDGEVLSRGPHIMKGYWKQPEATAATIRDGWLYTGDLGRLDDEGFLYITGRKKELMVLSNGKKVVPVYLEGRLVGDPCIDQAVVHGEGKNFLTALLVPRWDEVRSRLGLSGGEETLCEHPAVRELLRERLEAAQTDLAPWEQVKKFLVLPRPFSVAADEMTVSLKLRRHVVLEKYREPLDRLYREPESSAGSD